MSKTTNSFSSVLAQFTRLQTSALEILQGLSAAVSSSTENVVITFKTAQGELVTYNVPSLGYIEAQIERLDKTLEKLMGMDGSDANIRMPDGSFKKIYQTRLLKAPNKITGITSPNNFAFRNNWFFESFLSPALYVPIDVSNYVLPESDKILVKRVILNITEESQKDFFNEFFKGRNDIRYEELIANLQANDISFFVDEDVQDLPLSVLRYEGTFDVIRYEDTETENPDGTVSKRRKYFLNKLTYTDNLVNSSDSVDLKVGNQLVVGESIYKIDTIDTNTNGITLKKVSGFDGIQVGIDILRIYSSSFSLKKANVGVGFDERQVIFFKAVDPNFNIVSTAWSDGIAFYSNELTIETQKGLTTLEQFYRTQVVDFGQQFLSAAKEKTIPAVYGEIPNSPVVSENEFKVVRINEHKFNTAEIEDIQKKAADKVRLNSEIVELDSAIEKKKAELTTRKFDTDAERRGVKNELDALIREKTSKSKLYATLVQELAVLAQDKPAALDAPKYRIRGFFELPEPKDSEKTGLQYPIQFEIEYRYLRLDGSATGTQQFEYTDSQGITQRGSYSNWVTEKSDIRKKVYNDTTGIYEWSNENVEDPDAININQIDIPISKGEKVEIRIRSISEAGWPINPLYSEFSESVIMEFPEEFVEEDEASLAIASALEESTRVAFQQELDARGLDLHLSRAFTTGDKYFAHESEQIASGYFTPEGNTINLFEKLKAMETEIAELRAKVEQIKGKLVVTIVEPNGTKNIVKNGDVVSLFAGYYEDFIKDLPAGERKGAIVSVPYRLLIENSENSPLELVSRLPGGIGDRLPNTTDTVGSQPDAFSLNPLDGYGWVNGSISPADSDYNAARKYDWVPIANNSVDATETNTMSKISSNFHQSQQLLSQFIYSRYTDIGLSPNADLYKEGYDDINANEIDRLSGTYNPTFRSFVPALPSSGASAFVWSGTYTSNVPDGNGVLNDFCIHIEHPALNDGTATEYEKLQSPDLILDGYIEDPIYGFIPTTSSSEATSAFRISRYAGLRLGSNYIGTIATKTVTKNDARAQLDYRNNWKEYGQLNWVNILGAFANDSTLSYPLTITNTGTQQTLPNNGIYDSTLADYILPDKLGFIDNDRYLIGNKTCGAYLYMAPTTIDQLLVDGTDARAIKFINTGDGNGLEIPLLFQFRMTDYFGPGNQGIGVIGGFDPNASVQITSVSKNINLSYSKRIGFDIYVKNETIFSLDVEVSAKYRRESLAQKTDLVGKKVATNRQQLTIKKTQIKDLR
jgi:hypothetical protein